MKTSRSTRGFRAALVGVILMTLATVLVAGIGESDPPSSFVPAADLRGQVDFFLDRLASDLQSEDEYKEDQQIRVARDATTLAVLALVLGKHDTDNDLKKSAPAVLEAAIELADSAEDFADAKAALADVKKALKSPGTDDELDWETDADLALLMEQVPIVNNSLRRGVSGRRFKRLADKNAGFAATLAAIAQASIVDTSYCEDEESEPTWRKISAQMRDATTKVNRAVHELDQPAAKTPLAELVKTCDDCHEEFNQ